MSGWRVTLLILPIFFAFGLDLLLGDPAWLYHPVRLMGRGIACAERLLRRMFPASQRGERAAGALLAAVLPLFFLAASGGLLLLCWMIHPAFWFAVETVLCYQLLAVGSLTSESMAVYDRLAAEDLAGARLAVGRIVGRDVDELDAEQVARAAVETVAENTTDGVISPLLYMALGGAPLAMWYKAVNTLDSMIGYKNERYLHFGRAAAKLDDVANYLPARFAAGCMLLAAEPAGFDQKQAARICRRDRRRHDSPNAGWTEAACAGALGIQLGGKARYGGVLVQKPTLGDPIRPPAPQDIARAVKLMRFTALTGLLFCAGLRTAVAILLHP